MSARPALVSWSGGKDSALAMWRARRQGWEPVALFNMLAAREERSRSHGLAPAVLAAQAQALG
ncbi:adenosine nucleotide hydrolase, partial [Laribacter hongkongensis]|nr:adenosine nucleotide hydrolase [Laribacter hongkongensis]